MRIQDYLHLYPKVPIAICEPGVEPVGHYLEGIDWYLDKIIAERANYDPAWIKPILRPLSDITEEEAIELVKLNKWKGYGGHPSERNYETYRNSFGQIVVSWGTGLREKNAPVTKEVFYPNEVLYLLSKHFDIFGLIESGLAIDKTKTP